MNFYDSLESIGMTQEDFMDDCILSFSEIVPDSDGKRDIFWAFNTGDNDFFDDDFYDD